MLTKWSIFGDEERERCYRGAAIFKNVYCPPLEVLEV
jgi:hypothetical protein